jgi:hypothetical protein
LVCREDSLWKEALREREVLEGAEFGGAELERVGMVGNK